MADKAASVLARLKNKGKETGRSYQLCIQLFLQEEFLRRVELSKHNNHLILKGGLFLYSLSGFESRITNDIDFLTERIQNTPENLIKVLEEIIATETGNDFIWYEIKKAAPIALTKKYAGVSVAILGKIKNVEAVLNIDFGFGDVIVPKQEKRRMPTQLDDFVSPTINTYSIETTIAEKLDAILSLMEFSSRMKDYYDIYYLAMKYDFDGNILCEALKMTFSNRGHQFTIEQFKEIVKYNLNETMLIRWKAFIRKTDIAVTDFSVVTETLNNFVFEVFEAVISNSKFNKQWKANENKWK